MSCGIPFWWRITYRVKLRVFLLYYSSIQRDMGYMGQNSGVEEKLSPDCLPGDIRRWVVDGLRAVPPSPCVFLCFRMITRHSTKSQISCSSASTYFQCLWGTMAELCSYGNNEPDKAQMIVLCLSIYLKACLYEMGIPLKCKYHLGSLAYEPRRGRPKTNFYLTWILT